jgi:serine/threonine protein kinase
MPLSAGARLGPYEVISPLGSGGMGEVYLGRDTRLGREVAIKILPPEFSSHADRLRRFEQEARSASALNHPNIITIYEIGASDSSSFIAMEYVDGKTLRELLQAGPMQIRKAVQIAVQMAEALGKAHEAGIVHRDLKPENIMITRDGYAKVLDFGLAKLAIPASGEQVSVLPTTAKTDAGVVLGTVGYMSPEQACAGDVDFRSDQFSIGAILYEMVTGKRAFQKKTSVETLSAIINEEPEPVQSINPRIAAPIRWIIERCMEKNPQDRYASTRDLARDLQSIRDHFSEIASSSETEVHPAIAAKKKQIRAWDVIAVGLILALSAALFYFWKRPVATQSNPATYHRLTYRRGPIDSARYSPDGNTIVYSARWEGQPRELFVTRPDAVESRPLGISGADVLSISSSGEMLLLIIKDNNRKVLAQVSLTGGTPRELAEDIRAADWSSDGSSMALARYSNGRVHVEFPPGKTLYETSQDIGNLRFSPSGQRIAFTEKDRSGANGTILIFDRSGKKITQSQLLYPLGLAWHSEDQVWFTTISDKPGGGCELYSIDSAGRSRYVAPFIWAGLADISKAGSLLIILDNRTVVAQALAAGATKESSITWLDQSEIADISPDDKKILIHERGEASETPSGTIYMANSDGTGGVRLAGGRAIEFSPDGKSALGIVARKQVVIVPVGVGSTQTFDAAAGEKLEPIGFMPDGKQILLSVEDSNGHTRLDTLTLSTRKRQTISEKLVLPLNSRKISPDGNTVIVQTPDLQYALLSLKDQTIRPLENLEVGEEPIQWSNDGQSIFVYSNQRIPCTILKLRVSTPDRQMFKQILPPDPTGIVYISTFRISPDESTFAYSYQRTLSALYQIHGLQ